jgi:hypothetical protein
MAAVMPSSCGSSPTGPVLISGRTGITDGKSFFRGAVIRTDCKPRANNSHFRGEKGVLRERCVAGTLLTRNFLYSTMTLLSDAPLAQLDRALDFGSYRRTPVSHRHFNVFSRLDLP